MASSAPIFKCKADSGHYSYQANPCPKNAVAFDTLIPDPLPLPPTKTSLVLRARQGQYTTAGTIHGIPVNMLIDTGASNVAIPLALAREAGLRCRKKIQSQTANGIATGCSTRIERMTFGPFTLGNFDAIILPNLEEPLLGMTVLSIFQI